MGGKSIAHRAASYRARKAVLKYKMSDIFKNQVIKEYPNCIGTYEDCPSEIKNPEEPPEQCRKCPLFIESKYYKEFSKRDMLERSRELAELFKSLKEKEEKLQ